MPHSEIKVKEYQCSRCEWKWIARKNGKDKPKPSFCPRCKTWMWDIERKNDMNKFHRWQAERFAVKGMIWDRSTSKWKKPTDESEKEELHEILDGREKVRSKVR
jgi:hypothetical protein